MNPAVKVEFDPRRANSKERSARTDIRDRFTAQVLRTQKHPLAAHAAPMEGDLGAESARRKARNELKRARQGR